MKKAVKIISLIILIPLIILNTYSAVIFTLYSIPKEMKNVKVDPKDMAHIEAIILSMTPYERRHPESLKASRKMRIAKGSARSVEEVNRLLKQFEEMKKMMKNGNMKMPFKM